MVREFMLQIFVYVLYTTQSFRLQHQAIKGTENEINGNKKKITKNKNHHLLCSIYQILQFTYVHICILLICEYFSFCFFFDSFFFLFFCIESPVTVLSFLFLDFCILHFVKSVLLIFFHFMFFLSFFCCLFVYLFDSPRYS